MAQDFRNNLQRNVGTSPVTLITAGDFDAVIGIRICNTTTSTVLASCQIVNGGNDHFIAKNVSIPPNSAIELPATTSFAIPPEPSPLTFV